MSNPMKFSAVVAVLAVGSLVALRAPAAQDEKATQAAAGAGGSGSGSATGRYYEMRTYTTAEGKLEDLHNRFRNHTNRLFKKHGIEMVGYWTPADEQKSKNTLVFILAYPSREEQPKRWQAFVNDPEWKKAAAESERNGKLVVKVDQLFMNPTDYSPAK